MKTYCLATWKADVYREDALKTPECFAFFAIGTEAELIPWAGVLDLPIRSWLVRGTSCIGFDIVADSCVNFAKEVEAKRWELQRFGLTWEWSRDLIPGAPAESTDSTKQNTFDSEDEFLQSLIAPIDLRDSWEPMTHDLTHGIVHDTGHLPVPVLDGDRPAVPITIPRMH